ncbi:unnamed protein product [Prunus armeniaca]
MVVTLLLIVGQNNRYCLVRDIIGRSHFTASKNFNKVLGESTRFYPYFKDCVSAIDGTTYSSNGNRMRPCNFDLEFIYFLSGWEGSAHDSRVPPDALIRRNGLKVPQGVRYHLQEFGGQGHAPANEVEFNLHHSSLRNVIERIFGTFKSRFTVFKSAPPFPYTTQIEIVLACNKSSSSSLLPVNEGDPELVFQTQEQEQERQNANECRVGIALDMWRDAGTMTTMRIKDNE